MKTLGELEAYKQEVMKKIKLQGKEGGYRILVGMATCGKAAGAGPVIETFKNEIENRNIENVEVILTGCIGVCKLEPIVEIWDFAGNRTTYIQMTPQKALRVVNEHVVGGKVCEDLTI